MVATRKWVMNREDTTQSFGLIKYMVMSFFAFRCRRNLEDLINAFNLEDFDFTEG